MTFRYAANLGFLWNDRPLAEGVYAAAAAGFDAVECHFPFDDDLSAARAALEDTGLPMLGLNTRRGDVAAGDFGLAAGPGRADEARDAVDQAIAAADVLGARAVHVMAGRFGDDPAARHAYIDTLSYAAEASPTGLAILIEPINRTDVPSYHLSTLEAAAEVIENVNAPNVKIMFDAYHCAMTEPPVLSAFRKHLGNIAHVQIAACPGRGEPDQGALDCIDFLKEIKKLGYSSYIAAEYKPQGPTVEDGLSWLTTFRAAGV